MGYSNSNVFVKYLPSQMDDAGLGSLFGGCGEIVSAKVMVDNNGASLGYG
jgi:RNA recognition motif-containing protein